MANLRKRHYLNRYYVFNILSIYKYNQPVCLQLLLLKATCHNCNIIR